MSNRERRKGLEGERAVAAMIRAAGFAVRGLEGSGDFLALGHGLVLHVETKRQEVARPWQWQAQAILEAPGGTLPLVAFRRSRSPWWGMSPLDELLRAFMDANGGSVNP